MKRLIAILVAFCASAAIGGTAVAQTYAITDGTVYTLGPSGKIDHGTVIIQDGKITAVGASVSIPADAVRIDATGKVVTPGIFDPLSQFGLVEVGAVKTTRDAAQSTAFSAAFNVADAINPQSVLIPVNRIAGVTRAVVAPTAASGGKSSQVHVILGQGVTIDLGSTEGFIHRDPAAMFAILGEAGQAEAGGSRAAALLKLREALTEASDYASSPGSYKEDLQAYKLSRMDLEALGPVVDGKLPLVVSVNRASDIKAALKLASDFKLKLVIAGGAEAWMVADRIAAAQVPVILNPIEDLPTRFEILGATLHNAARLQKAGVLIAFEPGGFGTSADTHNARNLTQGAGNAVAYGVPYVDALRAIMLNPAKIYGVADEVGSLEAGKVADVVVWEGDPLQVTNYPSQVFIDGKAIPMESRQTLLRDRYLKANFGDTSGLPAGYIKPGDRKLRRIGGTNDPL